PDQLAGVTAGFVFRPELWRPLVHHDPTRRWFERLLLTSAVEVWLIGWAPGQATSVHDHGGASGGLTVAEGELVEEVFERTGPGDGQGPPHRAVLPTGRRVRHDPGRPVGFPQERVHRVWNLGPGNATSVHAYS